MSERAPAQNKTSATPSRATQTSSPLLHRSPLTDEQSESVGSNSNISKELGGIQPKTIRRSLNWENISVEAPNRGNGMSLPGGIQRQQEEQEGTPAIEHQVSAKKAETSTGELSNLTRATEGRSLQPKTDHGRLNWRNISVEASARSGEASSQPIQRQQKEQEETPEIQVQLVEDSAEKAAKGERSNVQSHEDLGGHTGERHIGKSENWLKNRLRNEPETENASSFYNDNVANRTQGEFVQGFREDLKAWLETKEGRFVREITMKEPIGIVVRRNKKGEPLAAVQTNKARMILVRDNSSQGWHIRTSFPIP